MRVSRFKGSGIHGFKSSRFKVEVMRDIVITGEGIVSAIGNDKASVLQALLEGRSGIAEMRYLRSSHHELPVGEVKCYYKN